MFSIGAYDAYAILMWSLDVLSGYCPKLLFDVVSRCFMQF